MTCKSYRLLFSVVLLFFTVLSVKAQDTKTILLKNIDSIPMPPLPGTSSLFMAINEKPEIIATVKFAFWPVGGAEGAAIATSKLGKGKILVIGASDYLKAEMLTNKNITQLLKNALSWAKPGNKPRHIAVSKGIEKGFADFLKQQNATVYLTKNFKLQKNTDLLIVNEDVTDAKQLKLVTDFVTNGGTLLFASPYSDMYNSPTQVNGLEDLNLGINKLLAKAGLNNPNMIIAQSIPYTVLGIDSVPDYLQIKTLIPALQKQTAYNENANVIIGFNLDCIFKYSDPKSAIVNRLKTVLKVPDVLPVPTMDSPLYDNTILLKAANKLTYQQYAAKQDFDHHPLAKAKGYKSFPGDVPASAPRINETVIIPLKVGTQGLNDPAPIFYRPHSTGLYVPAGEKVIITISGAAIKQHLKAQIGVHDDNLTDYTDKALFVRAPVDLTKTFNLDKKQIEVYSPYGGLLLINIADTSKLKAIKINVKGAVKAPYFKLGETSEEDWINTIRNNPAPWAELATDNIVLTVPSYRIRNLSNPVKLMQFWDEVMDADADLAIISRKRVHQERIIVDIEPQIGYMFTVEKKIVVPDDESCAWMLDEQFMRSKGSWGIFHEIGHRHQFWKLQFPGTTEVTVNLFTMYIYDKVLHKGIYQHDGMTTKADVIKKIKDYLADKPSFEKWQGDYFLALSMYIQLIDAFGWDAFKAANTVYRNLPKDKYPKTAQDKRDLWFATICKATNSNLTRFFDTWKVPVSDAAKKEVEGYEEWFPKELE
jgi:hypothetical protein